MASTLILNAYDQNGELVAQGDPGSQSVTIKGVSPTVASNYQVAFEDGDGRLSPKVVIGSASPATSASSATSATSDSSASSANSGSHS